MTRGGFGFHAIWENLEDYVRELDIEKIKIAGPDGKLTSTSVVWESP